MHVRKQIRLKNGIAFKALLYLHVSLNIFVHK